MRIKFLGAAQTVTGSCTQVSYKGKNYLVDCGLFQGPKDVRVKNWNTNIPVDKIEAIILTHAHIDHSGFLPKLVQLGYKKPIYCTSGTKDLCKIMLPDSGYLQEEDAMFANKTKYSHHDPAIPLYTERDAMNTLPYLQEVPNDQWFELTPGLSFQFRRNGHILGSAFVQMAFDNGHKSNLLTFSGDLGNGRSEILKDPLTLSETDYLILESTYGDRNQSRESYLDALEPIINKVIKRGGTLVIPAFSVGRSQELLYLIKKLKEQNRIPSVPVYLDSPMAQDATEIYLKHSDELKQEILKDNQMQSALCCAEFKAVKSADESMMLCMSTEPKIVISAAGMLTGGRILHHLKSKLPDEKSGVLFVGYQVEGTKGALLKNGLMTINFHHKPVNVEAEIFSIDSMSAHADSDDLVEWVRKISNKPKKIFLNHGSPSSAHAMQYRLKYELNLPEPIVPIEGQEFDL